MKVAIKKEDMQYLANALGEIQHTFINKNMSVDISIVM